MFRLSRLFCNGSNLTNYLKNSGRTLYTLNSLGIDGYVDKREKMKQYYLNGGDVFREKMNSFLVNEGTSMIFTEDLKNMVHIADPTEKDLQLLEGMIRTYHKQNKNVRFGNFVFGPVVMRLFHHINKPDVALKFFNDPEFDGFFDQLSSYQILCDLLYEQGRYQDIYDVYEAIRSKQIQGGTNPRYVVMLVFAACYKENTPASFKYCSELFMQLTNVGHIPLRRAITFAAALALKQNAPHVALEIVGTIRQQNYVTVRNIKVQAYANLRRADDALAVLKGVLQGSDTTSKHTITRESIDSIRGAVSKQTDDNELTQNLDRLEKFLVENGQVDNKTLDDILTVEIDTTRQESNFDRSSLAASYNNNSNNNRNSGYNRGQNYGFKKTQYGERGGKTGLTDMD